LEELYERAARAAYDNSKSLLYEGKLLARSWKFARAYALCVLSSEEFCKAVLYKCVSAKLVGKHKVREIARIHSEKIERFIHIVVSPYIIAHHPEYLEALHQDSKEPDHAKHVFPDVASKIALDTPRLIGRMMAIFRHAEERKLDALYVEVRGGRLVIPKDAIGERQYREIEDFVRRSIFGFEIFLGANRNQRFRKVMENLDPGLMNILAPKTRRTRV